MSKNKNKTTKAAAKGKDSQEDDWDSILTEAAAVNAAATPVVAPVVDVKAPAAKVENTNDSDDEEDEEEGDEAGGAKKDKKKKKKKGKKEKEEAKKATVPLTAAGRAIAERQRLIAEEEARVKKINEDEEARIRAIEEKEEIEKAAVEAEKERLRKKKAEKLAKQKEEGTFQTKAQKEATKKAELRLQTMRDAGMLNNVPGIKDSLNGIGGSLVKDNKKGGKKGPSTVQKVEVEEEDEEKPATPAAVVIELPDEWDADDDGDSWETNISNLAAKVETLTSAVLEDNVEDQLQLDEKSNFEALKKSGLERAKREEEARLKREEEEEAREEMERKELEAVLRKETSRKNRNALDAAARAARTPTNLRSPISCIMGHVDTGKTKLLDKIRHTNVQEGEAGGITQQIGATQFSRETLIAQTMCMQATQPFTINLPGLLVIDTPGHESFTNLRSRGSSLCDIAILVIDLMHGLEPQTIESINLLKRKRTPFVVALNKVDRCYGWKSMPDSPFRIALAAQDENCQREFKDRADRAIVQLMEQGLNAKLYWDNDDLGGTVSLVPTSAVSGEGVPDLLKMVITLTQERLTEQIMYMELLQCTVLEVKVIEGLGHTVDVVLVNGTLKEGDTIVVSTLDGPVVTNIRALLTPPPNREMRIKSEYVHHQVLSGAVGIKIVAPDIGRAIAGTPVMVVHACDDLEDVKEDVQSDLTKVMKSLQTDNRGVTVHASTLGALEALLQFLREECKPPIPVSHISIGPIHKKDIMRTNIMNEKKLPEFATILAFDVEIDAEAKLFAEELNVRIFSAEIIYHLFDQFTAYMHSLNEIKKAAALAVVAFPCMLKILPQHIFNKKDPIVIGVEVMEGTLRLGTTLCIPSLGLDVGKVTRIENNHKEATTAKKSMQVSVRIVNESNPTLTYGRQFDEKNVLYSKISRASIDACKDFFKDEMTKEDWALTIKLKKIFNIQ